MKLKIVINGKTYDVEVEDADEGASLGHDVAMLPSIQSAVLPSARGDVSSDFDEAKVCRSPLAGVVTRLEVRPGQLIQQDQLLLVLEAMKMEIKITAQVPGTIKSIDVALGDAVRLNQVLLYWQ